MRSLSLLALLVLAACGAEPDSPGDLASRRLEFATRDLEGFHPIPPPGPNDWLTRFPDQRKGQTFEKYVREEPNGATEFRNVLAFMPVGEFGEDEKRIAQAAMVFAGLYYRLPVRALEGEALPLTGWQRERGSIGGGEPYVQYRTDWFLDHLLPEKRPEDAVVLIGVTMADLYPSSDWSYVFGMAEFRRRVAVYSLVRHFGAFWGEAETDPTRHLALRRSIKLVTHEIGHAFGLRHCVHHSCCMNGSNSLPEADRAPVFLCPVCLKKLQWNRGFDVLDRYRGLLAFFRDYGLVEEAVWTRERIARLEAVR